MDPSINYIVAGLERSGTSMLMQMLHAAEVPISFDDSRSADQDNPRGYYELAGGKIIDKLMNHTFNFNTYKGKFIKITAYGLKFLPYGKYKVIYSERDIDEILDSMEKMAHIKDTERSVTKKAFVNLNIMIKNQLIQRKDIDELFINYNKIIANPQKEIIKIQEFLGLSTWQTNLMHNAIDIGLYRHRKKPLK